MPTHDLVTQQPLCQEASHYRLYDSGNKVHPEQDTCLQSFIQLRSVECLLYPSQLDLLRYKIRRRRQGPDLN